MAFIKAEISMPVSANAGEKAKELRSLLAEFVRQNALRSESGNTSNVKVTVEDNF